MAGTILGFQAGVWRWGGAGTALGLVLGLAIAYRLVMKAGAKPLPTAPDTTLPSVLKALYLQQAFTTWAIEVQSCDDNKLHAEFGRFVREHQPGQVLPSQTPGVVKI